jgi:tetratricopeptide (TPR) repeat protein
MVKKGTYTWILGFILILLVTSCAADAETYDKQGREYADEGEYSQAIEAFTKAIEADPEYADAYNNRGNTYRKNGDLDEALADLNKALQLDPGHYRAYKNRAKLFATQGELDQALADFNQSIELNSWSKET